MSEVDNVVRGKIHKMDSERFGGMTQKRKNEGKKDHRRRER